MALLEGGDVLSSKQYSQNVGLPQQKNLAISLAYYAREWNSCYRKFNPALIQEEVIKLDGCEGYTGGGIRFPKLSFKRGSGDL